jgi:hypothetical protein
MSIGSFKHTGAHSGNCPLGQARDTGAHIRILATKIALGIAQLPAPPHEEACELPRGHRLAGSLTRLPARNQPTFLKGCSRIVTRWALPPPLSQQIEQLGFAILAACLARCE